jgi:hypothetical protein
MEETKTKLNFTEIIINNREYIYPAIFYFGGLVMGSFCYKVINNTAINKLIELIFNSSQTAFTAVFLNRFSLYFSVFVVCVFLGMCLIGFPLINAVPLLMGIEISIKIAFYYIKFGVKGIGFSMLMIIPEGAAIATVLIYTIKTSTELSKSIYQIAAKGEMSSIDIKYYVKNFVLYGLIVALIALINAVISFFLSAIIKL